MHIIISIKSYTKYNANKKSEDYRTTDYTKTRKSGKFSDVLPLKAA